MSEQEVKELDLNGEMLVRREKLAALRAKGNPFPNKFRRDALAQDLHTQYDAEEGETLKEKNVETVSISDFFKKLKKGIEEYYLG